MSFYRSDLPTGTAEFGRIFPPRPDWLARAPREEVLDPELEIVDTHHHLFERPGNRYLLPELEADLATGHRVTATVYVDAEFRYREEGPEELAPVGETEAVAALTAGTVSTPRPDGTAIAAGIVGRADIGRGAAVGEVIDAHLAVGDGRFRGVRLSTAWDADPTIGSPTAVTAGMLREPRYQEGARELARRGLVFDAWGFHPQLPDIAALARAVPELTVVLGHTGGPLGYGVYAGRREEVLRVWRAGVEEVARQENTVAKLGGVMMRLAAYDYVAREAPPSSEELAAMWGPYLRICIDAFGPQRCMFESNFPVDKMGIGYRALWNAFKRVTADYGPEERRAMFSGTAERVYRLDLARRDAAA